MKKLTPFAAMNGRERNSAGDNMGVVRSPFPPRGTRPRERRRARGMSIVSVVPQPMALARTKPHVTPKNPAPASSRPTMSSCDRGPKLSVRRDMDSGMRTRPIGTLSQKIQCQLIPRRWHRPRQVQARPPTR